MKFKKVGVACDHAGYELKQELSTLTLLLGAVGEVCIEHVNTPPVANISLSICIIRLLFILFS